VPKRLNFQNGHIAVGGAITAALAEHRVLTAMLGRLFLVIAHTDDVKTARQTARDLDRQQEGLSPVWLVLISDAHLDALAAGVEVNLAVLAAGNRFRPHSTAIRATNVSTVVIHTEYGDYLCEVTTTRDMHAGDIYTCGVTRLQVDNPRGLAVYRAKEDFNPDTGELTHHLVEPGKPAPEPGKRTGAITGGPDQLVHRVVDRDAFLEAVALTDLIPT
jgi:hypothetical protein